MIPGVALVTGAGRGTGRAVALALGAAGARVVVIDVNPDAAERTAAEIGRPGPAAVLAGSLTALAGTTTALARQADVSNKLAVQTLLYNLLEAGERLAVLVNAAHVAPRGAALTLDEWEWNRTLDVNLKGVFLMSQTAARAMKETGGGLILNVSRPAEDGNAAVSAAAAGIAGLTAALAAEWAPFGVRVELLPASSDPPATAAEARRRCEGMWTAP